MKSKKTTITNIPRYVDTFEEEEPIDLDLVQRQLSDIDKRNSQCRIRNQRLS